MALALKSAGRIKPSICLGQALQEYENLLNDGQKARLRSYQISKPPEPSDVIRLSAEINQKSKNGQCLGTRFQSVLDFVQKFSGIVDTVVGGSQQPMASAAWGLVKLSIQIAAGPTAYFKEISKVFMEIGRDCPRFAEFGAYFMRRPSLQDAICDYYISIVTLCKKIVSVSNKNGITKISLSLFHSFGSDLQSIRVELEDRSKNVLQEISLASKKAVLAESSASAKFRNMAVKLVGDLSGEVDAARAFQDEMSILNACSEYKFNRTSYRQARRHGSVSWFREDPGYLDWRSSRESGVLLCTGILGSGKTVLAANLVEHAIDGDESISATYFFCRHDYEESCRASVVLGTMLRELLESHKFNVAGTGLATSRALDCEDIVKAFLSLPGRPYKFILVVDGLDECDPRELKLLLRSLKTLVRDSVHNFSVFCTCRNDLVESISAILLPRWNINMAGQDQEMGHYIRKALENHIEDGDIVLENPQLALHIYNELLIGANGMMLWVKLQLDDLCCLNSDAEILHALHNLPEDLPETYRRVLRRLRGRNRSTELPCKMFRIIAAAKRPLHIEELRECLNITVGETKWNHNGLATDIRRTVGNGGSLLFIDEEAYTVHFTHHSVFQFLSSFDNSEIKEFFFEPKDVDTELGGRCLTYMFLDVLEMALTRSTHRNNKLLREIPNAIVQNQTSRSRSLSQALVLLRRNTPSQPGIIKVQETLQNTTQSPTPVIFDFKFVDYALAHWVAHTRMLSPESERVWELFSCLCNQEVDLHTRFSDREMSNLNLIRKDLFRNNHVALLRWHLMKFRGTFNFSNFDLEPLIQLAFRADFDMLDEMATSSSLSDPTKWQLIYPIILTDKPDFFWQMYFKLVPLDRNHIATQVSEILDLVPQAGANMWLPERSNRRSSNWSLVGSKETKETDDSHGLDVVYPLSFAMVAGKTNTFRSLIRHGHLHDSRFVPPKLRGTISWPLVLFREALKRNRFKIAKILLDIGEVPMNGFDDQGKPPLYYALEYENEDVVRKLLEFGAEARLRRQDGQIVEFSVPAKYRVDLDSIL